jgi:hypothetical protein
MRFFRASRCTQLGAADRIYHFIAMSDFVPIGYLSIRQALDRLGRKLFGAAWTGEEHKARRGLISEDEWLKIKDLAPARGSGATGSGAMIREIPSPPVKATPHSTGNPSDPRYQEEDRARKRYEDVSRQLRVLLEAGDLEAAVWDGFTGTLHRASAALWRQSNSERMIEKGQAPIPSSPNIGTLLVKEFPEASAPAKPIPRAKIEEAIKALKEKTATESLTRAQQKDFVRKSFPTYRVTERQLSEIFRAVPVLPGRPKKSDKKV